MKGIYGWFVWGCLIGVLEMGPVILGEKLPQWLCWCCFVVSDEDDHDCDSLDNSHWWERCRCWHSASWLAVEELTREGWIITCGGKGRMVFNNKEGRWLFAFVFFLYLQISVWKKDEDGLPSLDGGWVSGGYWWRDQWWAGGNGILGFLLGSFSWLADGLFK